MRGISGAVNAPGLNEGITTYIDLKVYKKNVCKNSKTPFTAAFMLRVPTISLFGVSNSYTIPKTKETKYTQKQTPMNSIITINVSIIFVMRSAPGLFSQFNGLAADKLILRIAGFISLRSKP